MVATDPVDARLLAAVAECGRAAVHDVAARVGMDPREVASRLIALSASGLPLLVGVECDPNGIRAALASAGWQLGGPPNPAPAGPGQPGAQLPGPGQVGPGQTGPGQTGPGQAGPGQAAPPPPPQSFPGQGPHGRTSGPYSVHGTPSGPHAVPGAGQTQAAPSGPYAVPGSAQGAPSGTNPAHTGQSAGASGYPAAAPVASGQHSGPHHSGLTNSGLNNSGLNNSGPHVDPRAGQQAEQSAEQPDSAVQTRPPPETFGIWGPPQVSFWARGDQQAAPDMERTRPAFNPARAGKVGQTLKTVGLEGEQLAIQLVELVDPADSLYTAAGYKLSDGERAVVVHTELTNHSSVPFPSLPDLYLVLVAEDGRTISKAPVALSSRPSYQIGVRPGETAGGHTVFVLSDTVRLREVRWSAQPGDDNRSLTWTIDD